MQNIPGDAKYPGECEISRGLRNIPGDAKYPEGCEISLIQRFPYFRGVLEPKRGSTVFP